MQRQEKKVTFRSRVAALVGFLLVSGAGAQTQAEADIEDIRVDAVAQRATVLFGADLGFPDGVRWAQVELDCKTRKLSTRGIKYRLLAEVEDMATDPQAVAALKAKKVLKTGADAFIVTTDRDHSHLWLGCIDGKLVTDLRGYTFGDTSLYVGHSHANVGIRHYAHGVTTVKVPVLNGKYLSIDFSGKAETGLTIDRLGLVGVPQGPTQAFFYYDAARKTLVPLQYGSNSRGVSRFGNVKVPKDGKLIFYYAPDYTKATGWQKVVLEMPRGLTWNEPASKPTGAKFAN